MVSDQEPANDFSRMYASANETSGECARDTDAIGKAV